MTENSKVYVEQIFLVFLFELHFIHSEPVEEEEGLVRRRALICWLDSICQYASEACHRDAIRWCKGSPFLPTLALLNWSLYAEVVISNGNVQSSRGGFLVWLAKPLNHPVRNGTNAIEADWFCPDFENATSVFICINHHEIQPNFPKEGSWSPQEFEGGGRPARHSLFSGSSPLN